MKRCGIILVLLVLALFALPTLADSRQESCARERAALSQQMKQLQADRDVFNRECGGTRSKSEYAARNCGQRGAALDRRNTNLAAASQSYNQRCK
jgi:hypothetical protein